MSQKTTTHSSGEILRMVADVVSQYLKKNPVSAAELPSIISAVHGALSGHTVAPPAPPEQRPEPAVPIRRSITPEYLICLEDGKKLKMLKRHLATAYGMTPDDYRQRWNLPADYPMVAPQYAEQRSALAKQIGLGSRPRTGKKTRGKGRRTATA
jgi:predicted transcriptional regulator